MIRYLILIVLCAACASGQDKPKPAAPVISQELKYKLSKAQTAMLQAQLALQAAQKALEAEQAKFNAVGSEIVAACGKDYQAQLDANQEPVCVEKPKEAPKP